MRMVTVVFQGVLLVLCAVAVPVAAKVPKSQPLDGGAVTIDELAQNVFDAADRNHNHVLNKSEFANAERTLAETIDDMGRQGVIGKPKKANKDKQQAAAASNPSQGDKLARSNKVSQAEFTFFAHSMLDEADENWRQMRAAAEAQQKAYNAQRRAMRANRGRGPYRYPY
jgi:hypothetical protein